MDEQEYIWDGENKVQFLNEQGYLVTRIFFTKQMAIDFMQSISLKMA